MKTNMVDDVMGFKSPKKRIRKLSPNIIRVGDTVKIINPEIIIRVGYPMSFDDACKEVKELYHNEILEFLNKTVDKQKTVPLYKSLLIAHINENEYVKSKIYKKLVYALAYEHMHRKGFGGKERKIYSEQRQELLGITAKVTKIFIKKTGIYFSPSGGYDNYSGEYDYDPGGLDKEKTHKILELDYWLSNGLVFSTEWETHYPKIEACNVEKIHEGDSQNSSN